MKETRKNSINKRIPVCVVGLGYVGSANSIAISMSKSKGFYLFDVIGLEIDNLRGRKSLKILMMGYFL